MIKSADIIAVISTEAALPLDFVALHARRLREAGLFVKETRSPSSPRVQPRHVANLLFMLLSEQPAAFAAKTIERAERLTVDPVSLRIMKSASPDWPDFLRIFDDPEHRFIDVLECLIDVAARKPYWFDVDPEGIFQDVRVEFSRQEFIGCLSLRSDKTLFCRDVPQIEIDARYSNGVGEAGASREFQQTNTIFAGLFAAIGRALARGAQ